VHDTDGVSGAKKSIILWLPDFLSTIASDHIEELVFAIRPWFPEDIDLFWPANDLRRVLRNPGFSRLRQVHFVINGRVSRKEVYSKIRKLLPDYEARGILKFGMLQGRLA
jgi:hypothetical protein